MSHLVTMIWHVIGMLIAGHTDEQDYSEDIVYRPDLARRRRKRALEGESSRAVIG